MHFNSVWYSLLRVCVSFLYSLSFSFLSLSTSLHFFLCHPLYIPLWVYRQYAVMLLASYPHVCCSYHSLYFYVVGPLFFSFCLSTRILVLNLWSTLVFFCFRAFFFLKEFFGIEAPSLIYSPPFNVSSPFPWEICIAHHHWSCVWSLFSLLFVNKWSESTYHPPYLLLAWNITCVFSDVCFYFIFLPSEPTVLVEEDEVVRALSREYKIFVQFGIYGWVVLVFRCLQLPSVSVARE